MKKKKTRTIYQFKITLDDIKPVVWRRIQVPGRYNFWELNIAIQSAMGWGGGHLHQFETVTRKPSERKFIGLPDDDFSKDDYIEREELIRKWFNLNTKKSMNYEYDFGDGWRHKVVLEKIINAEEGEEYPRCLAGKRACPPEDCGGPYRYEDFLKILADPKHAEHAEMMDWMGGEFDSEEFDPEEVSFEDPLEIFKLTYS